MEWNLFHQIPNNIHQRAQLSPLSLAPGLVRLYVHQETCEEGEHCIKAIVHGAQRRLRLQYLKCDS